MVYLYNSGSLFNIIIHWFQILGVLDFSLVLHAARLPGNIPE